MQLDDTHISDWGEKVLTELNEMGIPPAPNIYETWFSHRTGSINSLSREIDLTRLRGEKLTKDKLLEMHDRFCTTQKITQSLKSLLSQIDNQAGSLQEIAGKFSLSTSELNEGIHNAENRLRDINDDSVQLKSILHALINNTKTAKDRNAELEEKLHSASTEIKSLQESIKKIEADSLIDPLTNTANRRHYDIAIKNEIELTQKNQTPLSLVVCDIDHFKKFNDTWGHDTGDQILKVVGQILLENTKGKDLVARYGGEEFVLILPETNIDEAIVLAEKIREFICTRKLRTKIKNHDLGTLTMSFGVSQYLDLMTAGELFKHADEALYKAKNTGRNKVVASNLNSI